METDHDFLRAIHARPADAAPRLVYADWLDEQGDPLSLRRSAYLRAECELDALPRGENPWRRQHLRDRMRELQGQVGDDWWQWLDWAKVDHCVAFEFECPQRWDQLTPTDDPYVRHCPECRQEVHYCRSAREAHQRSDAGLCVAIDTRIPRLPLRTVREARDAGRLLGRVRPQIPPRLPLGRRGPGPEPS